MIISIVFDWGGVVSPAGTPDEVVTSLSRLLNVDEQKAKMGFAQHAEEFKRGKISEQEFWDQIQREFNVFIKDTDRSIWTPVNFFQPNERIVAFVKELKSENYDVSVLSNTFPPTASDIRNTGWYDLFNTVILSSEVGLAKPDLDIYRLLLNTTGFKAGETIFIDDQEKCLKPAKTMGIHTVLAIDAEQIINDTRVLLS